MVAAMTRIPIEQGWWRHAFRLDSPNFGVSPATAAIDLVVIHSISLPPGEYGTGCVQQLFTNKLDWDAHPYFASIRDAEVSAHFFIERNGNTWQFVSCEARAWHAGQSSFKGRENCNDYSIGIELEGLEGQHFEETQYDSLNALVAALRVHYPIRFIAGHEEIAPDRKQDPGAGFEWLRLHRAFDL